MGRRTATSARRPAPRRPGSLAQVDPDVSFEQARYLPRSQLNLPVVSVADPKRAQPLRGFCRKLGRQRPSSDGSNLMISRPGLSGAPISARSC